MRRNPGSLPLPHPKTLPDPDVQRQLSAAGAWAAAMMALGGILFGVSAADPSTWPLTWLGLLLTAWGMQLSDHRGWLTFGLLSGGVFSHFLGHPWYYDATHYWGGGQWHPLLTGAVWFLGTLLAVTVPERLGLLLLAQSRRRHTVPIWLWFPLAWLAGEQLNRYFTTLMQGSFLFTQWQAEPVLRALGHWGWVPTTLFCLAVCAVAADSLYHRRWQQLIAALCLPGLLWLLPPLSRDVSALQGVAAVHMANYQEAPVWVPEGTRLLVWPEVIRKGRPRVAEGPVSGLRQAPPLRSTATYHVFGQETRSEDGIHNSLLAMGPGGQVLATRAKRLLFPAAERPLFGVVLPGRIAYIPGQHSTLLEVNGYPIAALLCLEAFNSRLGLEGKQDGARLLTLSAIDHDMRNSAVALRQLLGVSVLLAVETGLPVVRSSLFGVSALIAPNGDVLQASQPGQSGVLTLTQDWPAHIPRSQVSARSTAPR